MILGPAPLFPCLRKFNSAPDESLKRILLEIIRIRFTPGRYFPDAHEVGINLTGTYKRIILPLGIAYGDHTPFTAVLVGFSEHFVWRCVMDVPFLGTHQLRGLFT